MWDPTGTLNVYVEASEFQSTGPVWDPTRIYRRYLQQAYISIHGSRVGPDPTEIWRRWQQVNFNPRVPCGTRRRRGVSLLCLLQFQSTGPVWDPTEEFRIAGSSASHFNPRVPCGTRPSSIFGSLLTVSFQSTGPVWDPTLRSSPPVTKT